MSFNEVKEKYNASKIVVRLLSGIMHGGEFTLPEGTTLFLSTDESLMGTQHKGTLLPDNVIYLPTEEQDISFEVIVTNDEPCNVFIRDMCEVGSVANLAIENEIITVGGQAFAWRNENTEFLDSILLGNSKEITELSSTPSLEKPSSSRRITCLLVMGFILLSVVCFGGYSYISGTQRQINSISEMLSFSSSDYQIIYAKNNFIYVFSNTDKAADWAIQTIVRNPPRQQVNVVSIQQEEKRISQWIEKHWPKIKFHSVHLNEADRPLIRFSVERNDTTSQLSSEFVSALKKNFPYIDSINVEHITDKTIRNIANQGLKKMALSFKEVDNGDSVTFIILGVIEDGMLESIKNFVNQYYQQWGDRYINFSLELETDWFKDKSFKFGEQSYIKLGSGHWYFPKT